MLFCCSAIKSRFEFAEFIVLWTWTSCAWIGSKQPPLKCSTKLWKRKRQNNFAIIIPFHWFKAIGPHRISTLNFRNVVNENQYFFGISFAFNFLGLTLNVYFHFIFPENAGPTQKEVKEPINFLWPKVSGSIGNIQINIFHRDRYK